MESFSNTAAVIKKLQNEMPSYKKTSKDIFINLIDKLEIAKTNAIRASQETETTGTENPSTKVHILVRELQEIKIS